MQTPDGHLRQLGELSDLLRGEVPQEELNQMDAEQMMHAARRLKEAETGKPHPVFHVGEELELKGGRFRVHAIRRKQLVLKPVVY